MAERRTPTKEAPAQPHEIEASTPKTLSWAEILERLLELDERLKKLEGDVKDAAHQS